MPSKKPQINIYISEEQRAAIDAALSASGMELSQAIRAALAMFCKAQGIEWPEDMPRRGKYDRGNTESS